MSERSDVEELRPEETEGATRARPSLGGKYEYKQHSANSMPFTVRTHGRAATPSRVGWIRLLFNRTLHDRSASSTVRNGSATTNHHHNSGPHSTPRSPSEFADERDDARAVDRRSYVALMRDTGTRPGDRFRDVSEFEGPTRGMGSLSPSA